MKLLLIFLAAVTITAANAQDSNVKHSKSVPNMSTIRLSNGSIAKGWLYNLNDSEVVVLKVPGKKLKRLSSDPVADGLTSTYSINQISSIGLRKKNSTAKGMLIGFAAGAVTGAIIGFASGDDPIQPYPTDDPLGIGTFFVALENSFAMTAGEKTLGGAIGLGLGGAIVGATIGSIAKKKFIIGGKKEVYRDLQGDLMKRLIVRP